MKKIPLTQGKVALVDDDDYERISAFKWYAHKGAKSWYAWRNERQGDGRITVQMHRQVLLLGKDGPDVDHRDLDGLNNQNANLRTATRAQNVANTNVRADNQTGIKGVQFRTRGRYAKWEAVITSGGRSIWLGAYNNSEDAAKAYAEAAAKYHGEFARS